MKLPIGTLCPTCKRLVKGPQYKWGACQCDHEVVDHGLWVEYGVHLSHEEMEELIREATQPSNTWKVYVTDPSPVSPIPPGVFHPWNRDSGTANA